MVGGLKGRSRAKRYLPLLRCSSLEDPVDRTWIGLEVKVCRA